MKKTLQLISFFFIVSITTLNAQIIWDQAIVPDETFGLTPAAVVATFFNGPSINQALIYPADDFELTESKNIGSLAVYGLQDINGGIENTILDLSVYIFEDEGGMPSGDPINGGAIFEAIDLDSSHYDIDLIDISTGGTIAFYAINVDIKAANAGTALSLDAGTYWISVIPKLDLDENSFDTRWSWSSSALNINDVSLSQAYAIDPSGSIAPFANWAALEPVVPNVYELAFTIYEDQTISSTKEQLSHRVQIHPNPATDNILINYPDDITFTNAILSDALGNKIKVNNNKQIAIDHLAQGIYYLQLVQSNGTVITKKIIKQ